MLIAFFLYLLLLSLDYFADGYSYMGIYDTAGEIF